MEKQMTKDEKKQRIAEIFTKCYKSRTHEGLPISFIKLCVELNAPLLNAGFPEQFSSQKAWYWKKGMSIPLPTPFMLLKQATEATDWRHQLSAEVLEVLGK